MYSMLSQVASHVPAGTWTASKKPATERARRPTDPHMGATDRRYCACGATRDAPTALRIVSCVRCGRALMAAPEPPPPPPSSAVAAGAAVASQVLGAAGFCVVVAWAWALHPDARIAVTALLAPFALLVFAGGS